MALVDFDGAFLAVNPALCALVARSEEELLRLTWQSITHPDDIAPGEREVGRSVQGDGRTFRLPKRYVRPDGGVVPVLLSVSVVRSEPGEARCLLTQVVDMTEHRRATDALARLAAIVESSDDAIVSTDLFGTILSWNIGAERMYGYAAAEIVGRNISTIVPPQRTDEGRRLLESIRLAQPVKNIETVRLRRDASTIDVSLTLSPIFDAWGTAVAASIIARDITSQTSLRAELDRTVAALEHALASAREGEARSRRFLADAAHHLRNPVAGVRACAETLLRGVDAEERDRLLVEMASETARVGHLVDRLLRLARLEEGEQLGINWCDIAAVCRNEAARTELLAPQLVVTVAPPGRVCLAVDVDTVRLIIANLLDNARRHARDCIEVRVIDSAEYVRVCIRDDGPGLAVGAGAVAFEPFVSLDGMGGSGLGLTLSKRLAEAFGGDLTYDGGAFVLRLLRPRAQQELREPSALPAGNFRLS